MSPSAEDLRFWSRRFSALAIRSSQAAALEGPRSPEDCLARAAGLMALARAAGLPRPAPEPTDEDIAVYRRWARLRAAHAR